MPWKHKEIIGYDESDEIRGADKVWEARGNGERMDGIYNRNLRVAKNNGIRGARSPQDKANKRRAHGYKNFENYRLRALVECGVKL